MKTKIASLLFTAIFIFCMASCKTPSAQEAKTLPAQETLAQEKAALEKAAQEKAALEKAAQEKAEQEKAAQEKTAKERAEFAMKKWRLLYSNSTNNPNALCLLSENSIMVDGKEIRGELIFTFKQLSELEGNYGGIIYFNMGDNLNIIPPLDLISNRERGDTKPGIITLSCEFRREVTGRFLSRSMTYRAIWHDYAKMYYFEGDEKFGDRRGRDYATNEAGGFAGYGSLLRDFFNVERGEDLRLLGGALKSHKDFFLGSFKWFQMTFNLQFDIRFQGKIESVKFDYNPMDIPDPICDELADFIKRRGWPEGWSKK